MIEIQRKQFCVVERNHVLPQQPPLQLQQQQQKVRNDIISNLVILTIV